MARTNQEKIGRRRVLKLGISGLLGGTGLFFLLKELNSKKRKSSPVNKENKNRKDLPEIPGYEHVGTYDKLIVDSTEIWNEKFEDIPEYEELDPLLPKAMISVESGSLAHKDAFKYDPMQIANEGDFGLPVMRDGTESGIPSEGYEELKGIKQTPFDKGELDYEALDEEERITPELSIKYGIGFLCHKGFRFNRNGERVGFRGWKEAVKRYNGSRDYMEKVFERFDQAKK